MSKVSFEGLGALCATFYAGEDVAPGSVVKLTDEAQVGPCADAEPFCGLALDLREGCAAVQVKGFMTVKTADTLALGPALLAADGKGGVKSASAGTAALVVSRDTQAGTAVICL